MATASFMKEIDDKFCLCSICLEQLKEPKLLPCLHRFCKDCLDKLLQASRGTFKCPECREEIQIPSNGSDGFKTDFYMRNLVEHVQIQQSLQNDEIRECYSCSKRLTAAAYCFKCDDFLCTDCHHGHMTNKTLKDHQQHTLSVEDIESKNITPEKLASMRDAPRCHVHPSKVSELYCETCNNVPACLACMFGKHKGHDLHEVTELARVKRQMLTEQLKILDKMKADRKIIALSKLKEELIQNVTNEKEKLQKLYEDEVLIQEVVLSHIKRRREIMEDLKINEKQGVFNFLENEKEREIQEVQFRYDYMLFIEENKIDDKFRAREENLEKQLSKLSQQLQQLQKGKKELLESIQIQLNDKFQTIETIMDHFEKEAKRLENLNVMASNILASENDWTAVECIPGLFTAATNLMKDLKKEFPELETLTNVKIDYQQSSYGKSSSSKLLEQVEKKFTLNHANNYFYGATSSGDGNIFLTGYSKTGNNAFIIVMDMNGKVIEQNLKAGITNYWHVCDLPQNKVAIASQPNTIGVYDVHDGSYFGKIISDVVSSWPVRRHVSCVATDPVNNHILVGGYDSRDVYVFDDQLSYLHIITLPEIMKWPRDITVSDGHLLVCDYEGEKSYVTALKGLESQVVREFTKPDLGVDKLGPLSVCTDKSGFVYMLWRGPIRDQCYLVKYVQEDSKVLTTRKVDSGAMVVTVVGTVEGEKLLIATYSTIYLYNLSEED